MCGVVSIIYNQDTPALGNEAALLLKKLEYRGYDSTGAVFFKKNGEILLRKKVGAPSTVIEKLEIDKKSGYKFIGQVRWATFGSVTDENAQPHEVKCHIHLAGAHNGNISNTDSLKEFLIAQGHSVVSDNDGEMLVHLVEHFYAQLLARENEPSEAIRTLRLEEAIRRAQQMVVGSYAACITDPKIHGIFAMKSGSSLYAGKGRDSAGDFIVVSSDLTSVLSKTRFLIPMSEGEGLFFNESEYKVFSLVKDQSYVPKLTRSRLNIADIALQPKYHFFMQQEIFSSPQNIASLIRYYFYRPDEAGIFEVFEAKVSQCREILYSLLKLYDVFDSGRLLEEFRKIRQGEGFQEIFRAIEGDGRLREPVAEFRSEEASLLTELHALDGTAQYELAMIDLMLLWKKKRTIINCKNKLIHDLKKTQEHGGRIYLVASGTSYHATLVAGFFFNIHARLAVIPANPGMFRSLFIDSLTPRDIVIGVSQSGETKDLVDIFNDIREKSKGQVSLITVVNNENSTLPQEKSDYYLPILCGPEIAVAATKSFISQTALFYILAASVTESESAVIHTLEKIRYFMEFTLKTNDNQVAEAALKLFLRPSMHILGTSFIGLAKEGALKIREVVLNHTEGYDSAEFKHGPNTILGKNTIFSLADMEKLHADIMECFEHLVEDGFIGAAGSTPRLLDFLAMLKNLKLSPCDESIIEKTLPPAEQASMLKAYQAYNRKISTEHYFSSYPLLFICPPDERDKRITISQIHTHKIRGADIILIAEEDAELKKAVLGKPAGFEHYYAQYITLPKTGDRSIFMFQAAVILQLLAFKMSVAKMKYLNRAKIDNHGVHPDVPKNVSKSITVD